MGEAPVNLVMVYVVCNPRLRQRLQAWLMNKVQNNAANKAAAGIAGLIGNCSVKDAIVQAKPRFRCMRADLLVLQDFFDSPTGIMPVGKRLIGLTTSCNLGECDAFISHSWHDGPEAKWNAFQQW